MARFLDLTPEEEAEWLAWVASRPPAVRAVAEQFPPWNLYRLKSTGQRVVVYSFGEREDGFVSITVVVSGRFNRVMFDRRVFGIDPADLEPCEVPGPDEVLGALMTPEEVEENLPALRQMVKGATS